MLKTILILFSFCFFTSYVFSQNKNFTNYSTENNKTWAVTKYVVSPSQTDAKDLFKNYTFRFSTGDTATVMITDVNSGKTWKGVWEERNDNKVQFNLPFDQRDKSYSKIVELLSKGSMEEVSVTSTLLSLKTLYGLGQIVIELSPK